GGRWSAPACAERSPRWRPSSCSSRSVRSWTATARRARAWTPPASPDSPERRRPQAVFGSSRRPQPDGGGWPPSACRPMLVPEVPESTDSRETGGGTGMNESYVTVVGNVVSDPISRPTKVGRPFASLRIASTTRRWDAEKRAFVDGSTNFLNVVAFNALAANVMTSVKKGHPVVVYGRLRVNQWET